MKINPFDHPICLDEPQRLVIPDAWVQHIPFAMYLVDILKPRVIVELGTHTGNSYCAFCQTVESLGLETSCFAVDTWQGDPHAGLYGPEVLEELRDYHDTKYGDFSRLMQTTFDEAVGEFKDGSIDLLHIDGLHTYEAVKHDFETWLPKLSRRGVVVFHDIHVRQADFGVWKVWEELRQKYPSLDFTHGHGLGVIGVGKNQAPLIESMFQIKGEELEDLNKLFSGLGKRFEQELQMAKHEQTVQTLTAKVAEHEQTVQTLNAIVAQHDYELNNIKRSKSWKLVVFLRKVSKVLVPPGSLRARLARRLLSLYKRFLRSRKIKRDVTLIKRSEYFDSEWYQKKYPDVAKSKMDPARHYLLYGAFEGRSPSANFSSESYLLLYDDVWESKINPLIHYLKFGIKENRVIVNIKQEMTQLVESSNLFDQSFYKEKYSDVNSTKISPIVHFINYGFSEKRLPNQKLSCDEFVKELLNENPSKAQIIANYLKIVSTEKQRKNKSFSGIPINKQDFKKFSHPIISNDHNLVLSRTDYFSFRKVQEWLLLTNQMLSSPYSPSQKLAIGFMESYRNYLREKYYHFPQDSKVSIIMPTYNREKVIRRAINSVFKQKYKNWELIIIDDNSTDDTKEIVRSYNENKIKYISCQTNQGAAAARNIGLEDANGDYICYLDSDNELDQDFLLIMVNELKENPSRQLIFCAQRLYKQNGEDIKELGIRYSVFNRPTIENHNYIDVGVILHRKELVENHKFDSSMRRLADWKFILKSTEEMQPISIPCLLSNYFYSDSTNQNTNVEKYKPAEQKIDNYLMSARIDDQFKPKGMKSENLFSTHQVIVSKEKYPISIVIPNYNCLDYLDACLKSIEEYTKDIDYEIIVVDNKSEDDVVKYLKNGKQERMKVIFNDTNYGFTRAVNIGIEASNKKSDIVLLNNDTLVTKNWVEALQEVKFNYPEVGLIAPSQIVIPEEKTLLTHRPLSNSNREIDVNISLHHDNIADLFFDTQLGFIELSYAPFFCIYIPRDTLKIAGLLDAESGPHYTSDRFYCDMVRDRLNKRILYTPKSKVYHFIQQSTVDIRKKNPGKFNQMLNRIW